MGFQEAKQFFIEALRAGRYDHATRGAQLDRNWLASGRITVDQAVEIVAKTRGNQAERDSLHSDPAVEIWIFKPQDGSKRWYIKGYLIGGELHLVELRLLSFHPSGG